MLTCSCVYMFNLSHLHTDTVFVLVYLDGGSNDGAYATVVLSIRSCVA